MITAFTGHRPQDLGGFTVPNPIYDYVREQIRNKLIELGPDKIISGMAQGVDQWAVEIAIDLEIPFIAAVPYLGQELVWPLKAADYYRSLLKQSEEVVIVCKGTHANWKMQKRNEWMVDNCDKLIAVWTGKKEGGTYNCIKYAQSKNVEIIHIPITVRKNTDIKMLKR